MESFAQFVKAPLPPIGQGHECTKNSSQFNSTLQRERTLKYCWQQLIIFLALVNLSLNDLSVIKYTSLLKSHMFY